jgi:hypothetical protein
MSQRPVVPQREGLVMGVAPSVVEQQPGCLFAPAPPQRVYCTPAPFSSLDGSRYQRLVQAYGQSRPQHSL